MSRVIRIHCFLFSLLVSFTSFEQSSSFSIALEPLTISELGGLQSYAYGQYDGKWLIIGGRLDGLHRRQPWAAFDQAGHHTQLLVIDPVNKKKWTASIADLPLAIQEQLKSTNMQFYQVGKFLYLIGGYGHSELLDDHTTFSNLTAVDIASTIHSVVSQSSIVSHFRQITDPQFQVTGGQLEKIDDTFYLVGGHKFIGRYNPMGPNNGPGFVQTYTNEIRKFNLIDDGTTITIQHLPTTTDSINLHRRDYNLVAQIMPKGQEGITAFSGVFQPDVDLPFLSCVNIDPNKHQVDKKFNQYFNHYHCANFPIYSAKENEMNTLFFGGIAQYYPSGDTLTQDNNCPFVKTISRVSRNAHGQMAEYVLPNEMPALLGTGAELIPNENLPRYANGVIKYDELSSDTTLIGYIYGGISSSEANIFWVNDGTQSVASSQIYRVLLIKNGRPDDHNLNEQSIGTLQANVFPDLFTNAFILSYNLTQASPVRISIFSTSGKKITTNVFTNLSLGKNTYTKKFRKLRKGGTYLIRIETNYEKVLQKIHVEP